MNGYDSFSSSCTIDVNSGSKSNEDSINTSTNDRDSWKQSQAAFDLTCGRAEEGEDDDDEYLAVRIFPSTALCEDKLRKMLD